MVMSACYPEVNCMDGAERVRAERVEMEPGTRGPRKMTETQLYNKPTNHDPVGLSFRIRVHSVS